jgi:diguanylate cyclase
MKAAPDAENWRDKYFESRRALEDDEQKFRAMQATLKRLIGRLCIAALGQSSLLDVELRKLQAAIRGESSSDELEQIAVTLTEAIHALDQDANAPSIAASQPTKVPVAQSIGNDKRVRAILAAILAELRRDAQLIKRVDALDATLGSAMTHEQLPEVLSALTEIVGQRIHHIEQAKREVEVLLSQMVEKLDEIGQFVADQNQNQNQTLASSAALSTHVTGEIKAMRESAESVADLQQIRAVMRTRLESIGQHLQEFQEREVTRASTIHARNEHMQARVAELEAEANRLHKQLKNEQQLSLLDALTQIPNRLAYEKRIEEELKRWRRFAQPTCVAAWDIDHFKRINDTYGHRAGDRVLLTVAKCLASEIRATDFVARYGGEEFVMILSGAKLEDALRLLDAMRLAVTKLCFHFRGIPESVTISCGVTALLADDSSDTAFERADKAMYRAKDSGRNRCISAQ